MKKIIILSLFVFVNALAQEEVDTHAICNTLAAKEINDPNEEFFVSPEAGSCTVTVVGKAFKDGPESLQEGRYFSIDQTTMKVTNFDGWTPEGPIPGAEETCARISEKLINEKGFKAFNRAWSRFGKCTVEVSGTTYSIDVKTEAVSIQNSDL